MTYKSVRVSRTSPNYDIQDSIAKWGTDGSLTKRQTQWPTDNSADVVPNPCHSHNDYLQKVPLYDALAAGCTGIEADAWLQDDKLLIGHKEDSLSDDKTLQSLYIDPLAEILTYQNDPSSNPQDDSNDGASVGIFNTDPKRTVVLMIDIKSDGGTTFGAVQSALEPLRSKGWLTHWDGTNIIPGPLTVVGSGDTPFDSIASNDTYRDIFFDAPLDKLSGDDEYTTENSYYASASFGDAIGQTFLGALNGNQEGKIKDQIKAANDKGLKARYWDTPTWPTFQRDHIWNLIMCDGAGMLSMDDMNAVKEHDWNKKC